MQISLQEYLKQSSTIAKSNKDQLSLPTSVDQNQAEDQVKDQPLRRVKAKPVQEVGDWSQPLVIIRTS